MSRITPQSSEPETAEAIFTDVTLDVRPEDKAAAAAAPWLVRK
ncbi:MAG: hypothetical protein ABIX12_04300 [Rubrivivax sp.]